MLIIDSPIAENGVMGVCTCNRQSSLHATLRSGGQQLENPSQCQLRKDGQPSAWLLARPT